MTHMGGKRAFQRQEFPPPRRIGPERGLNVLPAFPAGFSLCRNLCRFAQSGVPGIQHGQFFPRLTQQNARAFGINLAGQDAPVTSAAC